MADPWLKFYVTDWQADPALRMCSLAARGLWIEAICVMHKATPYGHLLVNGQPPTDSQLAVLVGTSPDQIAAMLGELEAAGVFSRTRNGVIYSRRLTRMAKKAATARNNGRRGGNPSLCKDSDNPMSDKGMDKGEVKPQKLEARYSEPKGSAAERPVDPAKLIFDRGVGLLVSSGMPDRQARSFFGKLRKAHDDAAVIAAIGRAEREAAIDPVEFIQGALRFHKKQSANAAPEIGEERIIGGKKKVWQGAVGGWVMAYE